MRSKHRAAGAAVALVILASGLGAQGQPSRFGKKGSPTFSAERLTGVFVNDVSLEGDGAATLAGMDVEVGIDTDGATTTFALLGNGTDSGPAGIPRLAFDYFVIDSVSIGGSLTYTSSRDETQEQGRLTLDDTTTETEVDVDVKRSVLSFNPRVGYGLMFTDRIGLWARGGIAYTRFTEDRETTQREPDTNTVEDSETTASVWNLTLDAQLVFSPVDHVGFAIGPHLGVPLTGSFEIINNLNDGNIEGDASVLDYGISGGLVMWL